MRTLWKPKSRTLCTVVHQSASTEHDEQIVSGRVVINQNETIINILHQYSKLLTAMLRTYKDRKTCKWTRDQTNVIDIMEIIKNRKCTWAGHISRGTGNRWSVAFTVWTPIWVAKEIEEGNEKDGEMNYNSTGAMLTGV